GANDVLIATDVAARGLDLEDITHVINFDAPADEKAYAPRGPHRSRRPRGRRRHLRDAGATVRSRPDRQDARSRRGGRAGGLPRASRAAAVQRPRPEPRGPPSPTEDTRARLAAGRPGA